MCFLRVFLPTKGVCRKEHFSVKWLLANVFSIFRSANLLLFWPAKRALFWFMAHHHYEPSNSLKMANCISKMDGTQGQKNGHLPLKRTKTTGIVFKENFYQLTIFAFTNKIYHWEETQQGKQVIITIRATVWVSKQWLITIFSLLITHFFTHFTQWVRVFTFLAQNLAMFGLCSEPNWPIMAQPKTKLIKKEPNYIKNYLKQACLC